MDRRQQKTRAAIFGAFEQLLAQQSYSKITVQEIIDGANVGRSTFYAHFETKDALLRELCTELFDHVFKDRPGMTHAFSLSQGDSHTVVAHILYHLRDDRPTLTRLLTGESDHVFIPFFTDYLNEVLYPSLVAHVARRSKSVPEDFLQNHIIGSFVNMVQWWFRTGMKQSPDQLADHFLAVIEPII